MRRTPRVAFLVLGVAFLVLGLADRPAFIGLGVVFIVLSGVLRVRGRAAGGSQ